MTSRPAVHAGLRGYVGRMWRYLCSMFPLPSRIGFSALVYVGIASFCGSVHPGETTLLSWWTVLGIGDVFGFFLILRLMDELKDEDIDARLFPDRPLPSGQVRKADIEWSLVVVCTVFLAANLVALETFVMAAAVLGFLALMFVHFFAKARLRASLPLTLATHEPVIPLMLLHGFAVAAAAQDLGPSALRWPLVFAFVVMLWMPFLAWEICRKIRAPEQETEYVTYSQLLGVRGAVLFAVIAQTLAIAAGVYLYVALSLSLFYVLVLVAAYATVLWAHARLLLRTTPERAVLKLYAQMLLITLAALQVFEFGVLS